MTDAWTSVAPEWADLWGGVADPARRAIIEAAGVIDGTRALDVGCGSGEFLALLEQHGATATGVDTAGGMVKLAKARGLEARLGHQENLPFEADTFDLVTAVNALQFADDAQVALAESTRVAKPGGYVALANWAEAALNDIDTVERALEDDDEPSVDSDYRLPGGLEALLAEAGLTLVASGVVECPWTARDELQLVRGIMLGEDEETMGRRSPDVLAAAEPFRDGDGYLLRNHFRWAVARVPA